MAIRMFGLRWPSRGVLILAGLFLVAALLQDRVFGITLLPLIGALVLGGLRLLRRRPASALDASRISRRTSTALVAAFLLALVPAGHGVAPVALFLVHGWERFWIGTCLAWLALAFLGSSLVVKPTLAPLLALLGTLLAVLAWALFEAAADDLLLAVVASLPFLVCVAIHGIHLARIRPAPSPRSG